MLTWHQALPEGGAALADFEAEASRLAGVPVRQVASVSDRVRALALACADDQACRAASERLLADPVSWRCRPTDGAEPGRLDMPASIFDEGSR